MFEDHWNNEHKKFDSNNYDLWLDKYDDIISNCQTTILDMGCGCGNNALYLLEKGHHVIAIDYSSYAIESIQKHLPEVETKLCDFSLGLDFSDNSFDIIVADLSLHYFDYQTTINIMKDIKRVLNNHGYLFARVNSDNDYLSGSGQGKLIEEGYYYVNGYNKRFFNEKMAHEIFSIIGEAKVNKAEMLRYSYPKQVLEIVVQNNK